MATLQKIRSKSKLLVIVIGVALLAFLIPELLKPSSKQQTDVAEITGETVSIQLYQERIDENIENYKRNTGKTTLDQPTIEQLREQTWDQVIREYIMEDAYADLGIGISGEELFDMVQGNNIDPQIMQIPIFQNKETGQFDRNLVIQFLKNMELDPSGQALTSWNAFEIALVQQKMDQKYNTLVEKGLYTTTFQAKQEANAKNLKVDFDYVQIRYNTVSDSLITATQADFQAYYNENTDKYQQEESREINYVTFPVNPSAEDDKHTKEWIENLKQEFNTVENNQQFISLNSDLPFDNKYYAENELSLNVSPLFTAEEGTVLGSYKENNAYMISKVVEFKNIPDSVKARHILIRPEEGVDAIAKADSLLKVIENGGDFAALAIKYSSDGSASKGGDLGWFNAGAMVQPFNDACFYGEKGDIVTVTSQFGVHVIEVMAQSSKTRKVQIATVARIIEPSSRTYQNTYAAASKFGGTYRTFDAFKDGAEKETISLKIANVKREDKTLANLENPRQIIRWVYNGSQGEVSDIFEIGDVFIVVAIKSVQEKGTAPFANVSVEVEREVKKSKKADYLEAKMAEATQNVSTLQAVADNLNTPLKEAKNLTFAAYSVSGLGFEPDVQATAIEMSAEQISEPVLGKNGIFIIQVKSIQQPVEDLDITNDKSYLTRSYRSRVGYQVYEAIKEASEIVDNRANFY